MVLGTEDNDRRPHASSGGLTVPFEGTTTRGSGVVDPPGSESRCPVMGQLRSPARSDGGLSLEPAPFQGDYHG